MNGTVLALVEILSLPGVALRVGMMIGTAIILGFFLFEGYRIVLNLAITGTIFLIFLEWIRGAILKSRGIELDPATLPLALALSSSTVFALSIATGMYMGYRAKRQRMQKQEQLYRILGDIEKRDNPFFIE